MLENADLGGFAAVAVVCVVIWFLIYFSPAARGVGFEPTPPLVLPSPASLPTGIVVRGYREEDRNACVEIFESNAGEFVPPDRALFLKSIDANPAGFLVADSSAGLIACAGLSLGSDGAAHLWMGLVHRRYHRRGFGTLMLLTRLAMLQDDVTTVSLETSEKSEPLYLRYGFRRCSEPEHRHPGDLTHFYMYRVTTGAECDQIRAFLRSSSTQFTFAFEFLPPSVAPA